MTMVLNELWHLKPVAEVAISFGIDRGIVQNLMGMASIEASCLLKFCEELEEFWAFRELFKNLSQRLSNISTTELVPLMQLPSVKMVRNFSIFASKVNYLILLVFFFYQRDEPSSCTMLDIRRLRTLLEQNQRIWCLISNT